MEILDKMEYMNQLFDLYQGLLTERQCEFFKLYYQEDYSLQEISSMYNVSRNAVHDHLKKVIDHLVKYEEKLKLFELKEKRIELLDLYEKTNDKKYLNMLRKLDE